jgi:glycosyltransferase involved in cell wall biosynthesis
VRVDQVIPTLARRDAIGSHTIAARDALRSAGFDAEIFYDHATPDAADEGRPVRELDAVGAGPRLLLYQLSIGSRLADLVAARPEPLLVDYHNVTPASLLARWEPEVADEVALGRRQMAALASRCILALADSAYNETELRAAGYRRTTVVPLLIDMRSTGAPPDPGTLARLAAAKDRGGADLLFVGRMAPHKAQHDLVKMLAVLRRADDRRARLHLVGLPFGERYPRALAAYVDRLGLSDAVDVAGSVTEAQLEAYYRSADAFVCASDHEGFCVPLVEAMGHGLPVVAYAAGAVPETVDDAGLVLSTKEPAHLATAVSRVLSDVPLRRRLVAAAARRAATFDVAAARAALVDAVRQVAGP